MNKLIYAGLLCCVVGAAVAVDLGGTSYVNITSETADQAKNKAFNSARREVILQELGQYANSEQLADAIKKSSNEELLNIIASSSVASEKISDTTYSANISFVIDSDAARRWMEKYSVQNWLPVSNNAVVVPENSVLVSATLLQPMSDWIILNELMRGLQIDIATKKVVGNNVSFVIADKDSDKVSKTLRANGWVVQPGADGLKIWK